MENKINEIIENALFKRDVPPTRHSLDFNLAKFPSRIKFYSDKNNIHDFNIQYEKIIKDNELEIPDDLTFYDKFKIVKLFIPNYVVWTVAKYIPYKEKIEEVIDFFWGWSVSTEGDIFGHRNNLKLVCKETKDGYRRTNNVLGGFMVHRLVMSSFGDDIDFRGMELTRLTVNHKDAIQLNNKLLNLEWLTHLENVTEMSERLELSKPLKITLLADIYENKKGDIFYLTKRNDITQYGGNRKNFGTHISKTPTYKNCYCENSTVEELEGKFIGLPRSLGNYLFGGVKYFSPSVKVTLLENMGEFKKGESFVYLQRSIFKRKEFCYRTIRKTIGGRRNSYMNCKWETIVLPGDMEFIPEKRSEQFFSYLLDRRGSVPDTL